MNQINAKMNDIRTVSKYGLKVSLFANNELEDALLSYARNRIQKIIFGYSLVLLPKFKSSPEIFTCSDGFDIFLADGKGMYWLFRIAGVPVGSDLSLPDVAALAMNIADRNGLSVLLLGAKEDVNRTASENLRNKFPGAKIMRGINGYFSEDDEDKIVREINESDPDILIIGISSPKKEIFASKWKGKIKAPIIIPCGGVIDVFAGKTKREPLLIKKLGMTWLYRFFQEPARLFRPVFLNGLSVIFFLIPALIFSVITGRKFSIPEFYGIRQIE